MHRGRCFEHQRPAWTGGKREPTHIRYGQSGSKRAALHKSVLREAEYICYVCGLPGATTVDHIIPISEGGSLRDRGNLGAIHQDPCHDDKTNAENARRNTRRAAARALARGELPYDA